MSVETKNIFSRKGHQSDIACIIPFYLIAFFGIFYLMAKTLIKDRFATTPNELLNDKTISLKAKGLFAYIQSKPDDWDFSVERIANSLLEGVESIRNTIQELEKKGYLTRKKVHLGQGKFDTEYVLHITPQIQESDPPESDHSKSHPTESHSVGFPPLENHPNNSNKDFSKKEEQINKDKLLSEQNFENFWNRYGKKVGTFKCKELFLKLSLSEQEKILSVVDLYVLKTPDIKYRKNPLTWLNGKCWEDDYSDTKPNNKINSKPEKKYYFNDEEYKSALIQWERENGRSDMHDIQGHLL